jgi:ssDNA-binding Zn-finger/Zn-ribbon topoisomerase 1
MPSIRTKALGTIICPKCGQKGQLKLRWQRRGKRPYIQVDHYLKSRRKYLRSCYICSLSRILQISSSYVQVLRKVTEYLKKNVRRR